MFAIPDQQQIVCEVTRWAIATIASRIPRFKIGELPSPDGVGIESNRSLELPVAARAPT